MPGGILCNPHLHQPPLHVARLGGLDGGVDQALAAAHGVEEELRGREARVEAVGHEALGLGLLGWRKGQVLGMSVLKLLSEHGKAREGFQG